MALKPLSEQTNLSKTTPLPETTPLPVPLVTPLPLLTPVPSTGNAFFDPYNAMNFNMSLSVEEEGFSLIFFTLAVLPPVFAFVSFPEILTVAEDLFAFFRVAQPVDGNRLSVDLLAPSVNGVVVPTLSIALGTLFATTINVLRQRQVEIRACLNSEVCEMRLLRRALFGCFGTYRHRDNRRRGFTYLQAYTRRLMSESTGGAIGRLEDLQEIGGGIGENELDMLSAMLHGTAGASANRQNSVDACHGGISSLNRHRSARVAHLLSSFPPIHYAILGLLGLGICSIFLIEVNIKPLLFLNMLQLRTLFATIISILSATAALCFDLADPFRGSFSVTASAKQLISLQKTLQEDLAQTETNGFGSTIGDSRPLANGAMAGRDTLLFHLFTSKFADTARVTADAVVFTRDLSNHLLKKVSALPRRRLTRIFGRITNGEDTKKM